MVVYYHNETRGRNVTVPSPFFMPEVLRKEEFMQVPWDEIIQVVGHIFQAAAEWLRNENSK